MAYVDHDSLPRVIVSGVRAREILASAATEYVTGIIAGDSRNTWGGQGGGYLNALNLFSTTTFGIPQWSEMLPIGLAPPAGYNNDLDGTLRSRAFFTNLSALAGSTASGYDKAVSKAASMPGFPNQACSRLSNMFVSIMPEAVIAHRDLFAHNAQIVNRAPSLTFELWAQGITYPYNDGTSIWTGPCEIPVTRGYTAASSRTSTTPGYINNDAANAVAVGGFGATTTAFGSPAAGVMAKTQISIPFNPAAGNAGFPYYSMFNNNAPALTLVNAWGYRFQDPVATTGLSFTPCAAAGYTFASIPSLHGSSQAQVVALCEKSTKVVIWLGFGVNDVYGSGYTAAQISGYVTALANWYSAALPTKELLFVWDGYTPRLDDTNPNWAANTAVYRTITSAVVEGLSAAGKAYIVVNAGRMQEEHGWTVTTETIAAVTGVWAVGTPYTAGQIVSVTNGDIVRFFKAQVDNTGFEPTQERYRGQWIEMKDLLGGSAYNEGLHPPSRGEILRARMAWQAVTGMPMYSANGSPVSGGSSRRKILPIQG